ncbi:MAG TPA: hypothetical protein VMI54_24030, partial [Polyangiaceae bacterium]|nr:hypothetical protein [Polyangiaceae bacterium]
FAPPEPTATGDRFSLTARSETDVRLSRRALLPGPNGALVATETNAPVYEYLLVNARDVDSPWNADAIDLEFAAWSRVWPTASSFERPFDGDVQTANAAYHAGPAWVRFGRQQIGGGAARFVRFDGASAGAASSGFSLEGYGGFTVLPRWDERPGYHELGTAENALLRYPAPAPDRTGEWLAGGKLGYATSQASGSVSFHEQHAEHGLEHRNLGLDCGFRPFELTSLGASALVELDSGRIALARAFVDATPLPPLDLDFEALHAEPALLLSRQSVLSVFTTDGYDEFGGTFALRTLSWLRFEGQGYFEAYQGERPGARGELATRLALDRAHDMHVRIAYARVLAPTNAYDSVRVSLGRRLVGRLAATLEAYGYFYAMPIEGYRSSSVYAGTLSYHAFDSLGLLLGTSIAHSLYASLDAQALLRVTVDLDPTARRR